MLRLLSIFTFTLSFLIADAQNANPIRYKSSRKIVKEHICKECSDAGGSPGLPDIKNSKSEMEIRWLSRGHSGTESALTISRQHNIYEAHLYFYQRVNSFDTISKKWHHQAFKYKITGHDLDSVVKALTQIGIFTLPDQRVTKTKFFRANEIQFKIDNEVKGYGFGYLPQYIGQYPDEELYKKYDALLQVFNVLKEEASSQHRADMKIESKRIEKIAKKNRRIWNMKK